MRWISTTIKKKYMDEILSGEKDVEYKGSTYFWDRRLDELNKFPVVDVGINFLCGQKSYKFKVTDVTKYWNPDGIIIDGKHYMEWWEISIGERIE